MTEIKISSASHHTTNQAIFAEIEPMIKPGVRILDYGAGKGHMSQRIGDCADSKGMDPTTCIYPCEIVPEIFEYEKVECGRIDTNAKIPFEDEFFDVVCAIEVMEHTFRPYDLIKEAYRVLKPGGVLIISVPNLMHISARISLLLNGFGVLYPPPSKKSENAGRICGHIMPLSYPYFHYGFATAGFKNIKFRHDRRKRGCLFWAAILRPLHMLCSHRYKKRLKKYDAGVWEENHALVDDMNSINMLSSRSCIVTGVK